MAAHCTMSCHAEAYHTRLTMLCCIRLSMLSVSRLRRRMRGGRSGRKSSKRSRRRRCAKGVEGIGDTPLSRRVQNTPSIEKLVKRRDDSYGLEIVTCPVRTILRVAGWPRVPSSNKGVITSPQKGCAKRGSKKRLLTPFSVPILWDGQVSGKTQVYSENKDITVLTKWREVQDIMKSDEHFKCAHGVNTRFGFSEAARIDTLPKVCVATLE